MKYFWHIIFILIAVVVSIAVLPYLKIFDAIPNFIFLIVLSWLYLGEEKISLLWVALGGILLDIILPTRIGLISFSFLFLYLVNFFVIKKLFQTASFLISVIAILISSLILNLIFAYFLKGQFFLVFAASFYDLIFGIFIYYVIWKFFISKPPIKI